MASSYDCISRQLPNKPFTVNQPESIYPTSSSPPGLRKHTIGRPPEETHNKDVDHFFSHDLNALSPPCFSWYNSKEYLKLRHTWPLPTNSRFGRCLFDYIGPCLDSEESDRNRAVDTDCQLPISTFRLSYSTKRFLVERRTLNDDELWERLGVLVGFRNGICIPE